MKLFLILLSLLQLCQSLKLFSSLPNKLISLKKVVATGLTGAVLATFPAIAAESNSFSAYKNDRYHTVINVPASWVQQEGLLSNERTVVAFVDPSDADTSVSLAYTPIPADFTRLTSFGGADSLRAFILPRGEGVVTTVLGEKTKGETYFVEYTVAAPDAPVRHVQNIFALKPQEFVVGITAQTKEDTFSKHQEEFAAIMPSFVLESTSN